jgi:hypothetical protein
MSFKTTLQMRCIINAENISNAEIILNDLVLRLEVINNSLTKLKRYEDDFHYEVSFSIELSAETFSDLEYKTYKLCTTIVNGPWLFINLPKDENDFKFEAIFNHEAFIHHSKEYNNKLKWAHIELTQ